MSWHFTLARISDATSEMRKLKSGLTLARPRCFWPTPRPKGGSVNHPPPHLTPERQIQLKWNFDSGYICIWGSLKRIFVYIAFVLFTLLPQKSMKTGVSLSRLSYTFLKIHHKIFNWSKLVNFFSSEGGPSLTHSKNINFIGRECPNLEGGWVEV